MGNHCHQYTTLSISIIYNLYAGHVLSEQELLALDHVLSAHSNKKVRDIRRDVQQSRGRDLTLEEIMRSLKKAGLAALVKDLKENLEKGNRKHQIP